MLNAYSVDSITIKKWNDDDQWGEPVASSDVSVKGYVEFKTRLVRNISGEQVTSMVTIYLHKDNIDTALGRTLQHEDRMTVVGDDIDRPILAIGRPKHFSSPHYEIALR